MATNPLSISLQENSTPSVIADTQGSSPSINNLVDLLLSSPNELISETEKGIIVNLADFHSPQSKQLESYISDLHFTGKKLRGLDYHMLEVLLFGDDNELEILRKKYPEGIIIAQEKTSFDSRIIDALYGGKITFGDSKMEYSQKYSSTQDLMDAKITWGPTEKNKAQQMLGEALILYDLNFDDFFVYLWGKGVRFGMKYDEITEFFSKNKKKFEMPDISLIIASPKKPIDASEDVKDMRLSIYPNKIPRVDNDGLSDFKVSGYTFPQAKKGQVIFTLTEGKEGKNGCRIDAQSINYKGRLCRVGVLRGSIPISTAKSDYIIEEGFEYVSISSSYNSEGSLCYTVIANEDVFISSDRNGKIILGKHVVHKKDIGATCSGTSIEAMNEQTTFKQIGNIQKGYSLKGWDLFISHSEISGRVFSEKDIRIDSSTIVGGEITSLHGNIYITKDTLIHSSSVIRAINGSVIIDGNIEHSPVMADQIRVGGGAKKCTILGRKVMIHESEGNTISGESITVDIEKSDSDYVILIFYTILKHLQLLKNKISDNEEKLKKLQNELTSIRTEWKSIRESNPVRASTLLTDGRILEGKIKDLGEFLKKDTAMYDRMRDISDVYASEFQGRNIVITRLEKGGLFSGNVIIYPLTWILHNDLFSKLNPTTLIDVRDKRKFEDFTNLRSRLQNNIQAIIDEGVRISLPSGSGVEIRYDSVKEIMDKQLSMNAITNSRMDSHRELLIPENEGGLLFEGKLPNQKKIPLINVSINGHEGCYLRDISEQGSSFLIPKEMDYVEKDTKIAVSYILPGIGPDNRIESILRILRVEEFPNHIRISGDYINGGSEKKIRLFMIYLANQKK